MIREIRPREHQMFAIQYLPDDPTVMEVIQLWLENHDHRMEYEPRDDTLYFAGPGSDGTCVDPEDWIIRSATGRFFSWKDKALPLCNKKSFADTYEFLDIVGKES